MHVLGLPPAFVLSQDQTLKLKPPKGFLTFEPLHIVIDFDVSKFPQGNSDHIKLMKLTTPIIDQQAETRFSKEPICKQSVSHKPTKPPTYPFFMDISSKSETKRRPSWVYQLDRCSFHLDPNVVAPGRQ